MAIYDIYSKRQKRLRGEVPDVYTYDNLSRPLRVQIIHIWSNTIGTELQALSINSTSRTIYERIINILCHEYGLLSLPGENKHQNNPWKLLTEFFLNLSKVDNTLDVVELSFQSIDKE